LRLSFLVLVSVPEYPLHFGPETSITTPLWSKGLGFGLSWSCILKYASSRGCGNVVTPQGFPKSVGGVESRFLGFPCFPYSVISMACFGCACCKITITAKTFRGTGITCPSYRSALRSMPDERVGDNSLINLIPIFSTSRPSSETTTRASHGCRSRSKAPMVSSKQRIPALAFCPISQGRNVHFRTGMHSHGHSREVSRVVVKWDSIVVSTSPER
jgi:hypothetical protein